MAVTVLLVDDVAELRAVVRQALRLRGGFEVVGEAGDGAGAISAAGAHQPDVIVLDLGLPDLAGREVLGGLRRAAPDAQVIVYTGSATTDSADFRSAVEGYVQKDQDVGYLVNLLADLGRRRHNTATIQLGPDVRDVARARRFLAEQCRRWRCQDIVEDVLLVATELVTNALLHAGSRCELRARQASGILRLEVRDAGPGVPDPRAAGTEDENGRGLVLVSALCTAWGVDSGTGPGKLVWAEMMSVPEPDDGPAGHLSVSAGWPTMSA